MADHDAHMDDTGGLSAERVSLNISLQLAAADGDYAECEKLLKQEGADAWWEDDSVLNWSALHFAANGGHTKLVKLLLRHGALWNAGGCSPNERASRTRGLTPVVQLIVLASQQPRLLGLTMMRRRTEQY